MRYVGALAMNVEISIKPTEKAKTEVFEENHVVPVILKGLEERGNEFKLIMPQNIRAIEDIRYIAFSCIAGIPYTKDLEPYIIVELKNVSFYNEDLTYCLTLAEITDFKFEDVKEYVDTMESLKEEPKEQLEVVEKSNMPPESNRRSGQSTPWSEDTCVGSEPDNV